MAQTGVPGFEPATSSYARRASYLQATTPLKNFKKPLAKTAYKLTLMTSQNFSLS